MPQLPPNVNGVMELTTAESTAIKTKLNAIMSAFVPNDEQPACDTFYIVATYNQESPGSEINGDTAEAILN